MRPCNLRVEVIAAGLLLFLVACSAEQTELSRAASPGNVVSAVVVREDAGGGAGSRAYFVYLKKVDRKGRLEAPVVSAARCESLQPVWRDDSILEVRYTAGCRIFGFKNHWYELSRDSSTDLVVEVVLVRADGDKPDPERH